MSNEVKIETTIAKLSEKMDINRYGDGVGTKLPSTRELMDKINELVVKVNKLETKLKYYEEAK